MTWQRIDDDTYIDDTLVTCAEYQLFIDEMREQGKFLKPDHWYSYQFFPGQAREPILGVRYSDAKIFCEWLENHEGGGWYYRLPTQAEVMAHPLKLLSNNSKVSYWIVNTDEKTPLTWSSGIESQPSAVEGIRLVKTRGDVERVATNSFIVDIKLVSCEEYQLFVDEMHTLGYYYQPDHWTSYQFPRDKAQMPILGVRRSDARDFCRWLSNKEKGEWKYRLLTEKEAEVFPIMLSVKDPICYWIDHSWNYGRVRSTPSTINGALNLSRTPPLDLENATSHFYDNHSMNKLELDLYFSVDRFLREPRILNHDRLNNIDHILDLALTISNHLGPQVVDFNQDIYKTFFTLRERIAGRSPAFEGIRLVKERIK